MSTHNLMSVLALSGKHREQLRRHLFPGDGKEAVAIALCGQAVGTSRHQLLVHEVIEVPYEACRIREPDAVAWSVESVLPALNLAMQRQFTIVKFHSHPSGYDQFSEFDDSSDRAFFKAVDDVLDSCDLRASVVMLPDGRFFGRTVQNGHLGGAIDLFRIAGDDFEFIRPSETVDPAALAPEHAVQFIQTFGEGTYHTMQRLCIGVVGVSGTGSIVLEQLARNCVGEIVLVDPDRLERRNLNRILNTRRCDVGRSKVDRAREAILAMDLGTAVLPIEADVYDRSTIYSLSECDILFGCVDSVDGRHIINKIATHFLIPLIDLGVRIDADGKGGVDQVCGAVHTVLPGGSSLMSRGVYSQADLDAAIMKKREPARYEMMVKNGYVRGVAVDRPAVISLNMLIAACAVNEMIARLMPYRIDPNSAFTQRRISLSDPLASRDDTESAACPAFAKRVGYGAMEPLLGILEL